MPGSDRVALVTGASSGIGAVFARRLAAQGYHLILVARRADRLAELAREIQSANGVRVEVLAADLVLDADLAKVESRIAGENNLTLLVNNAGFGALGVFFESELEPQDRMHRLHVLATLRLTHAALPGMVARGRGGIINVSSVVAFASAPGSVSYSATKAWMNTFSEGLTLELKCAGSPVRVQALCQASPIRSSTMWRRWIARESRTVGGCPPRTWWLRPSMGWSGERRWWCRASSQDGGAALKPTSRVQQEAVMLRHARRAGST